MKSLALLVALTVAPASAQETGSVVLRAAGWLDVRRGVVVEDALIVVRRGRIEELGPAAPPADLPLLDLGELVLLPGLIDAHTHLTYDLEDGGPGHEVTDTPADLALLGARNARRTLYAGFTTVRDVGSSGFADVALQHAVERGWIDGPRILPAGHAIGITGGHCDARGYAPGVLELDWRAGVADGVDEVVKAVRYQVKHGARVIKVCATAGVLSDEGSAGTRQYSDEELKALVAEARRQGLRVAAHAHGREGILAAVRAGVHSIEHGSLLDGEVIEAMLERRTVLVPTTHLVDVVDVNTLPEEMRRKALEIGPRAKESLRLALRSGVRVVLGTDAGVIRHGTNARELAALVGCGATPLDALRAATLWADELLGTDDRGVIEPGRWADFVAVRGNPLEDVRLLEEPAFVMLGGRTIRLDR